ncbi:hypothetical protein [Mycobacterium kansasii]|uniref:hypothetical protein n=1 Tax=Mycobacterium kansasii TaxID=1768 RepID=UPI00115BD4D7|nr:hypothetical protein [Mycobacterium kansasii]
MIVKSTDYACVIADEFEVLIDPNPASGAPPAIGLMVKPANGQTFIMPIEFESAAQVAKSMLEAISKAAPHLIIALLNG